MRDMPIRKPKRLNWAKKKTNKHKPKSGGGSSYIVPIVKRELLGLWHDFWDGPHSKEAKHAAKKGSLGRTVEVKARNMTEAAKNAEAANPGCVAIRDAIHRLG